ncbi:MAG TPA: polyprenyl synthetase family protein [Anaerolineaceae bacterium]
MKFADFNQMVQPAIDQELRSAFETHVPNYPMLREMIAYHMGWVGEGAGTDAQGKRIRPVLVLLAAAASGGKWQAALPAAAAVEFLHNFSLVHDDIQDQSMLRRGRPTVWAKWGIAQAINTGDVLFNLSYRALNRLEETVSIEAAFQSSLALQKSCFLLTEGQFLDLLYESRLELPEMDYWKMISGKTAALISCCLELGALTAGVNPSRQQSFAALGKQVGLAFQVLDDWLGIWGDAELTGKSTESDLVSGKKTLPVVFALEHPGRFAERWKQGKITAGEVSGLAELLKEEGAYQYTLAEAERLTNRALALVDDVSGEAPTGEALKELILVLLNRSK